MSWKDEPSGTTQLVRFVMLAVAAMVVLGLLLHAYGCAPVDSAPPPPPTTTLAPSPTPSPFYPMSLLRRQGPRFVNDDGPVSLLGCIACCGGPPWPRSIDGGIAMPLELMRPIARASIDFMEKCAAHGGLYTEWRNGPNIGDENIPGGPDYDAYCKMPDGRYDLTCWNSEFWDSGDDRLKEIARLFGGYVGEEVLDNWKFRKRLTPYERGRNIQGFDGGSPAIKASEPRGWHRQWIRKMVKEWGDNVNVIWLEGNEDFTPPGISLAWAEGMARIIHEAEAEYGYPRHLVCSNAQTDEIERSPEIDCVIRHQDVHIPAPIRNKPSMMNETNPHSCEQFKREGDLAQLAGTFWQLWMSGMSHQEYQCSLNVLKVRQEAAALAKMNATQEGFR